MSIDSSLIDADATAHCSMHHIIDAP